MSTDFVRVEYVIDDRLHSVLTRLQTIPKPGETITVDHDRRVVVRSVETDPKHPQRVSIRADVEP